DGGRAGVGGDGWVGPMLRGATMEWLPPLGVSWHVAHEPTNESGSGGLNGEPTAPLSPPTPEIVMGKLLKRSPPRAMARRGAAALPEAAVPAPYAVDTLGSEAAPP